MLYDTHAHLNMSAFDEDRDHVAAEALAQHVIFNNVGTSKLTSKLAVDLADGVNSFAVVGLHPAHTIFDNDEGEQAVIEKEFDYEYYAALAKDPKVVGIGECGLDYYRLPEEMFVDDVRAVQQPVFEAQIKLAKELDKVLVVHTRASKDTLNAYEDTLEILKKHKHSKVLIHSFTGNWLLAERFLKLGVYLGLNGIITFDKTGALKEVIEEAPFEKIVLETDAPFLAPPPHRGKRNLPQYVEHVARYISEIKGMPYQDVAEQTTANAKKLFNI